MRYTIEGFSQEYALTLKKQVDQGGKTKTVRIDCTDLVILRWFVDFYPNMKKMIIDGKEYVWLSHKKLNEDLPILDINKRSCIDRMQKLVLFGILDYKLIKENGTFSLYSFGDNYIHLVQKNDNGMQSTDTGAACQAAQGACSQTSQGECSQTDNKYNSISDSSIENSNISDIVRKRFIPPTVEEVRAYCSERQNTVDAQRFVDYYTANGWLVGRNKMKDWRAAVRTWERNASSRQQQGTIAVRETASDDLDGIF